MRKILVVLALLFAVVVAVVWTLGRGAFGRFDSEMVEPVPIARSAEQLEWSRLAQAAAAESVKVPGAGDRQILFGDLHVHTTISFDAFMLNMPLMGGQGAAPPADACDFARHCAALDFWSINDHASTIAPVDWQNTIDAIRQCNARAGDPNNPDLVSFLGWEWTQAGDTPENHYGHKNVVLRDLEDDAIPARPIAAIAGGLAANPPPTLARGALALTDPRMRDLAARWTALSEVDICGDGPVRELPLDCREVAPTPPELFRKLDEWGSESVVIPHGTSWGVYTPPRSTWDKQLVGDMHDPERQTLLEVYSGHGDSEVYRDFRTVDVGPDGELVCPEPRPNYTPTCWRAGEVIERRCLAEGTSVEECAERAEVARANAARAGVHPHAVVPGVSSAELADAGQCKDCDQPSFNYRPGGSAQYISAIGNFDEAGEPKRFRMGFMAASDIHSARPGTGYKEVRALSESPARDLPDEDTIVTSFMRGAPEEASSHSRTYEEAKAKLSGLQLVESERVRSYLYTGGLMAVHSEGRDRQSIWEAFDRREVYGTSGPRLLLWFDLLGEKGEGDGALPMGSETERTTAPTFRVRAVGSLEQADGCPSSTIEALGAERTAALCADQCYRPTDRRRRITHVEIVRIRPQIREGEDVGPLIEDPWKRFECPDDPSGCVVTVRDAAFPAIGRDTLYYARAFEEPTPAVNGQQPQCSEFDENGRCLRATLCTDDSDCMSDYAHRAWSSPIWVDHGGR